MNVTALLALVLKLYPHSDTSANVVTYMNMAQKDLSAEGFGLIAVDETLETIANDDEYTYPSTIEDISQIEYLEIEKDADEIDYVVASTNMKVGSYTIANQPASASRISFTVTTVATADTLGTIVLVGTSDGATVTETITPLANSRVWSTNVYTAITSITGSSWVTGSTADTIKVGVQTDRYNYTKYEPSYKDDDTCYSNTFRQNYTSAGGKTMVLYPVPATSGYNIRIRYHKYLTDLSADSASASPEFDSRFHEMLAVYAAYMLASVGASPDTIQADRFYQQYDNYLTALWKDRMNKERVYPRKPRDNKQWH